MLFFDDEKRNVTSVSELGEYDLHRLCLHSFFVFTVWLGCEKISEEKVAVDV